MTVRSARAGFTLIELMIATIAGAFAVAGVYYLNGVSSRMFGEQMRVSETQMSLRGALEQVRRDFSRAGYLAVPNSKVLPGCDGTPGSLDVSATDVRSIAITRGGSEVGIKTLLETPAINKTRADSVILTGNFATADAYLANPTTSSSAMLYFQTDGESFRRSFFTPTADHTSATFDQARFTSVFRAGRMVRVENEGRTFFRVIDGSTTVGGSAAVTLTQALPACFVPTRWTAVSPVMRVRYALEDGKSEDLKRLTALSAAVGSARPILVRREVALDGSLVADTARVVLDYAVEFSIDPIVWDESKKEFSYALSSAERDAANLNPETLASLVVTLSSRSQDADPNLPTLARTTLGDDKILSSPLLTFRVVPPDVGLNARVRTARAEIFLQNH
jgi:prepilin-type N-terminal cleavage/methylation domain-containing protein